MKATMLHFATTTLFAACALLVFAISAQGESPNFERDVAPILTQRCVGCHSGLDAKGKLDLSHHEHAQAGGKSGAAIVPGEPDESLLWQYVESGDMPPKEPLPEAEQQVLRAWIAAGAKWSGGALDPLQFTTDKRAGRDWWSLQPLKAVEPPDAAALKSPTRIGTPIDNFVLAKLEADGLSFSPEADPRTLVRRLYYDLIGLPAEPEVVAEFERDPSSSNYEALVDKLLASPHYGERWGRHWLDIARYGETHGFERNEPRHHAWPYRDWVIAALNADLPYDEFARQQLAGDILVTGPEGAAAVGFLVAGLHNTVVGSSERMKRLARQDELEEIAGVVGQTFLGLTINCARCHDHKFDPVTTHEYYQFIAALDGVQHGEREFTMAEQPSALLPWIAGQKQKIFTVSSRQPDIMRVHVRGDVTEFGAEVSPAGVAAIAGVAADFGLANNAPDGERRRKLAEWITHPSNPLFARVMVNRVWHYHFGAGLIETPSDLGWSGGRPSHPELLDWLVGEFQRGGYRLKALHKLILMSSAYRQTSKMNETAFAKDAGNRLLWRYSPRRVEAEVVHDSMLQIAGKLNPQRGGPGYIDVSITPNNGTTFYEPIDVSGPQFYRRSIYRFTPRGGRSAVLDTFDCPDPSSAAPRRSVTTTPLQALSLLNNNFVLKMADAVAERAGREVSGEGDDERVRRMWQLTLSRLPDAEEERLSLALVEKHGLAALARALFNANEFVVIE